jgi:hypothetical protein
MNRQEDLKTAEALNYAIWVRDNVNDMKDWDVLKAVSDLGKYKIFSSRQISAITNNRVSHTTVSSIIKKKNKTGGNLNVGTLEILRNVLYSRADGKTDYGLISEALQGGTSQGMISKLTGVSQSSISRRLSGQLQQES